MLREEYGWKRTNETNENKRRRLSSSGARLFSLTTRCSPSFSMSERIKAIKKECESE